MNNGMSNEAFQAYHAQEVERLMARLRHLEEENRAAVMERAAAESDLANELQAKLESADASLRRLQEERDHWKLQAEISAVVTTTVRTGTEIERDDALRALASLSTAVEELIQEMDSDAVLDVTDGNYGAASTSEYWRGRLQTALDALKQP